MCVSLRPSTRMAVRAGWLTARRATRPRGAPPRCRAVPTFGGRTTSGSTWKSGGVRRLSRLRGRAGWEEPAGGDELTARRARPIRPGSRLSSPACALHSADQVALPLARRRTSGPSPTKRLRAACHDINRLKPSCLDVVSLLWEGLTGSRAMMTLVDDLVPAELWAIVEPLLPVPPRPPYGGRRRAVPDRNCFAAIVYMARTSTPWRLLPARELGCGSPTTC
jgi:Putative transposase of IS4/5 family (DUF4096)